MTTPNLRAVLQEIIAIIVLVGGGLLIFTGNAHASEALSIIALVVGFYFGQVGGQSAALAKKAETQ